MAKNTKSATLPSNLRHCPPSTEESETFFTKLKRKFRFKKGRYNVDISTGECKNVNPVSFKKRDSSDLEQPFKPGVGRSSERTSRSESPRPSKPTARSHSDRFVSGQLSTKSTQEGKNSNFRNDSRYPQMTSNDFYKPGIRTISGNVINAKSDSTYKGNEYSVMKFEKDESVLNRQMKFDPDHHVIDECVVQDDSAIDLDHFDGEGQNPSEVELVSSQRSSPGYERLPCRQGKNTSFNGSQTLPVKMADHMSTLTANISESNFEFDPNYESVSDVKRKVANHLAKEDNIVAQSLSESTSKSTESLDDPLYQSVKEVKKLEETYQDARKPSKTYDLSKSIESLDEPGYESLNDVKKRISENLMQESTVVSQCVKSGQHLQEKLGCENKDTGNLNDSAVSFSMMNDSMTGTQSHGDHEDGRIHTDTDNIHKAHTVTDNKGRSGPTDDEQKAERNTFDHEQNCNIDTGADLTESTLSKVSGFESKVEKVLENAECLYSIPNKKSVDEQNMDRLKGTTGMVAKDSVVIQTENVVIQTETVRDQGVGVSGTEQSAHVLSVTDTDRKLQVCMSDAEPLVPPDQISSFTEYDSDTELMLDPAYAECADAIKGIPPYHAFSDGSGSKISSCTSLDLSVEDFPPEPGYAECADAIKSGAIKKISVSHEKLIIEDIVGQDNVSIRKEQSSEIYANPQILLKKRSQMIERTSGELSPARTSLDVDQVGSNESLNSNTALTLTGEEEQGFGKGEESSSEAPPLPARNYSLYLESDEAADLMSEDDKYSGSDDAFESDTHISKSAKSLTKGIEALSNSADEKDIVRTNSESFEVYFNSKFTESESDCKNVEYETNVSHITKDENEDDSDLKTNTNGDLLVLDNGKDNINETPATSHVEEDECVQVTVIDKQGHTKILTVIDKQASQKHGSRRLKVSTGSLRSAGEKSINAVENDSSLLDSGNGRVIFEAGIEKEVTATKKDLEKQSSNNLYYEAYQEETVITDSFKSAAICQKSDTPNNTSSSIDREQYSTHHLNNHISATSDETSLDTNLETDKTGKLIHTQTEAVPAHVYSSPDTNSETEIEDDPNRTQNQTIPSPKGSSLEIVHPVKMYSISWDSDEELQGTEHLPKLEIVESDIENVFDCSDSSIKSSNNDNEDENLISRNSCPEIESRSNTTCSLKRMDKSESKCEESVNSYKGQTNCNTHYDESDSGHIASSVEEHLESGFTKSSVEETNTVEQAYSYQICENVASKPNTCLESVDFLSSCDRNEETMTMCNNEKGQSESEDEREHVSSECLPVLSNDFSAALYDDTEPTHMSLTEIMSLSVSSDTAILKPTQLPKSTASLTDLNAHSDGAESVTEQTTPPPRPPSYISSQSRDRNSGSSQSGQSNSNSPMEDTLPGFRFAERSLSDVEETPPAIPPRARIKTVQNTRRDSDARDFMESMRQLKDCGWYWGPLSWEEAEQLLANKPEGTFLVRDSSDERYILSLSFKNQGRVHHTRIEHHRGNFSFWSQPDSHGKSTIKEFIEQCVNNSENGRFLYFIRPSGPGSPPMPIHLLYPVSRLVHMQSLQHMCRFRILQMVRRDHIDDLPVPTKIKQYLKEAQYYVEYLDD